MALKQIFTLQSGTKKVLYTVILITLGIVFFAYNHYQKINRSFDPRIVEAKKAFGNYNKLMASGNHDEAVKILDKIESIYTSVFGYEDSFEMGVIAVNKGSVYLVRVETEHLSENKTIIKENLALYLQFAREHSEKGLHIYQNWSDIVGKMDDHSINEYLKTMFHKEDPAFKGYDFNRILEKRFEEIKEAQTEINRRISVVYTNLGVIARYEQSNAESKKYYEEALRLWPENHVAENNLRALHGQKLKKRGVVDQLFPKERMEEIKEKL